MEDDEVPLTGNALGNRLQAPPASGLPNGWVRHDTLQVVVPQPREPQDNTSNPEVIHVDDVDDWFAEEAEQAKGLEPQEGITASLFFYAPAGPVDRPESYVLSRKPFIATAVFPSGASAGFVDQMTAAGLSVRTFKNTSEDVLVLSAALVADSDVDRYVETVLGVRGTR